MGTLLQQACVLAADDVVSDSTLKIAIAPYKPHCHYLRGATVEKGGNGKGLVRALGAFAIPESCYIVDTAHFNAVEFNICYNQLFYCLVAQSIHRQMLDVLQSWNLSEFSRRQLSDFLIVEFSSTFHRSLNPRNFTGHIAIEKVRAHQRTIFLKTRCGFEDFLGAACHGEALIAVLDSGQGQR